MDQSFHVMLKPCMGGEAIVTFYFLGQVWSISMSGHRPSLLFSLSLSALKGGGLAFSQCARVQRGESVGEVKTGLDELPWFDGHPKWEHDSPGGGVTLARSSRPLFSAT